MPIRFECDQCGQRLSIARRKAGTQIDCPTCGASQRVPADPSAEQQEVEESPAVTVDEEPVSCPDIPSDAEDLGDEVVDGEIDEDEEPLVFGSSSAEPPPFFDEVDLAKTIDLDYPPVVPVISAGDGPPPPPLPSEAENELPPPTPRLPIPWPIFAQALLLLCVALGALSAGYYWGYQDGSAVQTVSSEQAVVAEPEDGFADEEVLLDGRILWTPSPGTSAGDASATFVALSQDRIPQSSLPIAGLQPGGGDNAETQASVAAIRAIGGVFTRTETDGTLAAVLPREGRYYLLIISRNASRPEDEPIRARDLAEMKQYFADPESLIGASKYVWQPAELRVGAPAVEHDFGLAGL